MSQLSISCIRLPLNNEPPNLVEVQKQDIPFFVMGVFKKIPLFVVKHSAIYV